jgi:transcriptional regulator with XRE-family HTH domain
VWFELNVSSSVFIHMTSLQLPNYLRSNRKRLALSQDEVAFLLGTRSGARVCRDERFVREPSLKTALTYEAIFQKPARELFSGLYQQIEQEVAARAKTLANRINRQKMNRQTAYKLKAIAGIVATQSNTTLNQS